MRTIGSLEKKIIDAICSNKAASIAQILCDNIPDLNLKIDNTENFPGGVPVPVKVQLVLIDNDERKENSFRQTRDILYILKFITYLENEGYALSGYFAHGRVARGYISNTPNFESKMEAADIRYTHFSFPDEEIRDFIFKYADRLIIPTHYLQSFRKRGYKTLEDKRHGQILWVTWAAVITSLALGILSLFEINLLSLFQK